VIPAEAYSKSMAQMKQIEVNHSRLHSTRGLLAENGMDVDLPYAIPLFRIKYKKKHADSGLWTSTQDDPSTFMRGAWCGSHF